MPITVKHSKTSAIPDAGDANLVQPSDWNADHTLTGLGTMAEQNANAVAITGGTISGVTIPASNVTGTLQVNQGGTGATTLTGYVKGAGTTALTASSTIPNTDITGLGTASTKDAGVALGVATLDAGGKVPVSELPAAVLGALSYQGTWNASTNTPTLTSSTGTKGYYYVVSVAGNTNLDGITDWLVGDWAVYNGTVWQKVDNTETVTSVNGQTGAVVLTTTNIAEGTNLYYTDTRARASNSAGTGISYDSGTGVITNAAPDQTVALTGGTGISTSGTYPNFTVTNTAPDQTVAIAGGTGISTSGTYPNFTVTNTAPDQTVSITGAGTSVVTGTYPNFTVTSTDSTTGTVTSVAATAGTGISVTGSPITTSGTLNITNTAPDQTVVLTAGTGISTSGTYPNFTITNTAPDQTVSLTGAGTTSISGTYPNFTITSNDSTTGTVTSVAALTLGTTGTDLSSTVANGTTTPVITLQVPTASATNRGALSSTDWSTFNGKANAFTYTTNYIPYGQGTTTPTQSANLTFDGTTQSAPIQRASNGIVTNNKTIGTSFTIPATDNAMSSGPVTLSSGVTVTVSSGSRWVVL